MTPATIVYTELIMIWIHTSPIFSSRFLDGWLLIILHEWLHLNHCSIARAGSTSSSLPGNHWWMATTTIHKVSCDKATPSYGDTCQSACLLWLNFMLYTLRFTYPCLPLVVIAVSPGNSPWWLYCTLAGNQQANSNELIRGITFIHGFLVIPMSSLPLRKPFVCSDAFSQWIDAN